MTLSAFEAPVVMLLAWLFSLFPQSGSLRLSDTLVATLIAVFLRAVVTALLEQPFVIRRRLHAPGGWDYAILPLLGGWCVVALLCIPALGVRGGLVVLVALVVFDIAEFFYMTPWRPGDTQEQIDERNRRFAEMTREHFADDVAEITRRVADRCELRQRGHSDADGG